MRTRIAIFDDNKNIRNSIILLLKTDPSFEVVGSYGNALNCVEKVLLSKPDVILMDIEIPEIDTIKQLKRELPEIHILIQTVFEDEERILELITAGASGYILKSSLNQRLRNLIFSLK
ncbi:MAG: response regulator transcription factor [Pedobacter sp.]|uniref:response regulator n=1 Tax=Pedobacter sp. TaxID=1411316 RepID=UPI00339AA15C